MVLGVYIWRKWELNDEMRLNKNLEKIFKRIEIWKVIK